MRTSLVYLRLELKRAWKRLPHMYAGAIVLFVLLGTVALLSSKLLYGDAVSGRITVGVVLPADDVVAEKALDMISSLDSVKSICDFEYLNAESPPHLSSAEIQEAGQKKLHSGDLYALLVIPDGFVQDIITGVNTPVQVVLPGNKDVESRVFRELADAGAKILAASQAGIYAGNELYRRYGLESSIAVLEADLNRIYLGYSLSRGDYFLNRKISATGDVTTVQFYGISAYVLFLLLCGIPASAYLLPWQKSFARQLSLHGIGSRMVILARIMGMGTLFMAVSLPLGVLAAAKGLIAGSVLSLGIIMLVCVAAAAMVVLVYQAAGTLMGGIMLLFLAGVGQHFLAGGFLPRVFLPERLQQLAGFLPSGLLMNGMKIAVTAVADWSAVIKLIVLIVAGGCLSTILEVRRS